MIAIYAATMLLSAALLFVVQPMVAKMLLPSLGGSSAVWTSCMLFFQALLLGGYAYAHAGARWLAPRRQALVHLALMLAAIVVLPITIEHAAISEDVSPVVWLLTTLLLAVGLPFFVVSASAPLLQHWFAQTDHKDAGDPYHLYAASNIGSMVSLLGYPFLIEPQIGVRAQSMAWAFGFGGLILATGVCAWVMYRFDDAGVKPEPAKRVQIDWKRRGKWLVYGFIPSSLMLGATQYLTTDIAAVPLFWVVPLAIYLLTFILVFSQRNLRPPQNVERAIPALTLLVMALSMVKIPMWIVIGAHLVLFFLIATHYHGRLADDRPQVEALTEFYLVMSLGGALGGLFNALIAPTVFDRLIEYWIVLILAVALVPVFGHGKEDELRPKVERYILPPVLFGLGGYLLFAVGFVRLGTGWTIAVAGAALLATSALVAFRPKLANIAFAAVIVMAVGEIISVTGLVANDRSFFASYKVFDRNIGDFKLRKFSHGTTSHGAQALDPEERKTPIAYHHPIGPVGQVLRAIPHERVAVVGLGAGAMAAYGEDGKHFDFYEIDPLVEEMARDYFTYLDDCGKNCDVLIGDGRLLVSQKPDKHYDIIFLDAYNSDSVPTHLLTREALQMYLTKLTDDGIIVFHVSNRYLNVRGVVGALANDAGLAVKTQLHVPPRDLKKKYVMTSAYSVVARDEAHLKSLANDPRWKESPATKTVWTDDYTNIMEVFEWD